MKVAMIGAGRWGKNLLKELQDQAEVAYVCTRSSNNTDAALADMEVEAVFIATPTETHFSVARQALEAGKHVFLEKPGTMSSADLEKLIIKAKEKNLKFAVGYEFPHHPVAKKLKELISGKKILYLRFEWLKWGTFDYSAVPHLLSHEISLMRYFGLGNLSPLSFKRTKIVSDTDIIETDFKNTENIRVSSLVNRASPVKQKNVTIVLEDGGYVWSNGDLFKIDPTNQALNKIEVDPRSSVSEEIKDFLEAIIENREPLINGEFALDVYKVIEQVSALQ